MASRRLFTSLRCNLHARARISNRYQEYARVAPRLSIHPVRFITHSFPSHSLPPSQQSQQPASSESSPPPQYQITFTCTAPNIPVGTIDPNAPAPATCNYRSTHKFTKQAYEQGIVLIECPSCKNRHLIADHLGWFDSPDLTDSGKMATVEDILRRKGEHVQRANLDGLLHIPQSSSSSSS